MTANSKKEKNGGCWSSSPPPLGLAIPQTRPLRWPNPYGGQSPPNQPLEVVEAPLNQLLGWAKPVLLAIGRVQLPPNQQTSHPPKTSHRSRPNHLCGQRVVFATPNHHLREDGLVTPCTANIANHPSFFFLFAICYHNWYRLFKTNSPIRDISPTTGSQSLMIVHCIKFLPAKEASQF